MEHVSVSRLNLEWIFLKSIQPYIYYDCYAMDANKEAQFG